MFTNLNLTDMETCYKVFRREVIQTMTLESQRFGFEPEITAKVARRGYRIYEVPISYYGRTYEEGKKIGWKDAVSALATIVRHAFREAENPKNVGHVTLARMGKLEPYNRWLADRFTGALGSARARDRRRVREHDAASSRAASSSSRPTSTRSPSSTCGLRSAKTRRSAIASYRFPLERGRTRRDSGARDRHGRLPERPRAHRGRPGDARGPPRGARSPADG